MNYTNFDCGEHGIYVNDTKKCDCDICYFGDFCSIKGIDIWGQGWQAFQYITFFFYIIVTLISWLQFYKNEHGSFFKIILRMWKSPKFLVISNLLIISNSRSIYLVIDPFNQRDIFGRKLDRIIHEIVFSTTFCILLTLLLVLTGLFSAFNIENNYLNIDNDTEKNPSLFKEYKFQILHTIVLIILVITYPVQFTFSYLRAAREVTPYNIDTISKVVFFFLLFFILIFTYFTIKFRNVLIKSYHNSNRDINHLIGVRTYPSRNRFNNPENQIENSNEVKHFLRTLKEYNLLNFFLSELKFLERNNHGDSEILSENENFSYEKDLLNDDENKSNEHNPFTNEYGHENNLKTDQNFIFKNEDIERSFNAKANKKQSSVYRFTNHDIKVLNKIVKMSLTIIIICSLLIVIGVLMKTTDLLASPKGTITLIIVSFFFELISFYFIFKLFLVEIHSTEYENLKIIGEIENYLKNNKQDKKILNFDEIRNSAVYGRLSGFMKISIPKNV